VTRRDEKRETTNRREKGNEKRETRRGELCNRFAAARQLRERERKGRRQIDEEEASFAIALRLHGNYELRREKGDEKARRERETRKGDEKGRREEASFAIALRPHGNYEKEREKGDEKETRKTR
jgi:hypothetical protein